MRLPQSREPLPAHNGARESISQTAANAIQDEMVRRSLVRRFGEFEEEVELVEERAAAPAPPAAQGVRARGVGR